MKIREVEANSKEDGRLSRLVRERAVEMPQAGESALAQGDPLRRLSYRLGTSASARAHATTINQIAGEQPARADRSVLHLQRRYGNRYVQRVVALARKADSEAQAGPDIEQTIRQARHGAKGMENGIRAQMESAFGADFSGIRVHTDARADALNRALNARAFTTGGDIFFRQGEYNPGGSSGRELLAHELTHVMQQNDGQIRFKLVVNHPNDEYEQEADRVARALVYTPKSHAAEGIAVPRQTPDMQVRRFCPECKDRVHRKSLREELEEEDGLIVPPDLMLQRATFSAAVTSKQPLVIQRSIEDAFDNYRGTCDCGEDLGNDCAHYLSDAFIRAGYAELDGGSGSLYRRYNGRIVCKEGRPVRAREMRDWFSGRATSDQNGEPDDTQYWAVYQHDTYPGGHVVIHHHNGTSYASRGTGDFPSWGTQRHYTW